MRAHLYIYLLVAAAYSTLDHAVAKEKPATRTIHEMGDWKADEYFQDEQVIALCEAIESKDLEAMRRLIKAGANVNAKGKDNMTPLMWAFPNNELPRFKLLLEHGADPNVVFKSDFRIRGFLHKGGSVTEYASKTEFPGYFNAVFDHGGNANMVFRSDSSFRDLQTPFHLVITSFANDKYERVAKLIDMGANLEHRNGLGDTPLLAVRFDYDVMLQLLEAGADYRAYEPLSNRRLIHLMDARCDRVGGYERASKNKDFKAVIEWLADHGETLEEAQADQRRWDSWPKKEWRKRLDAEIAERKAQEKQRREEQGKQKQR